jgi:hypothetical protein
MMVKRRRWWHSVRAELKHGERRRRAGRGAVKTRWGIMLLKGARGEAGVEASWPVSMPRLEGTGYWSQEREGV